jgi:hypothetical protein
MNPLMLPKRQRRRFPPNEVHNRSPCMVRKLDRAKSGCPVVILEQSPNPFAPPNATLTSIRVRRIPFDRSIAESLVVPLHVIMINVGSDRTPKMLLTERNDSTERPMPLCGLTRQRRYRAKIRASRGGRRIERGFGGTLGVGVSFLAAFVFEYTLYWPIAIPFPTLAVAMMSAGLIGQLFGAYPAWRACRLNPIAALRQK